MERAGVPIWLIVWDFWTNNTAYSFSGPSPRKRIQFLAAVESSKRELTEIPYIRKKNVAINKEKEINKIKEKLFDETDYHINEDIQ